VTDGWRVGANLATLANGLLGVGAILYVLAGNPIWAMLLVVLAIGFDGLDGLLSRRSRLPASAFGRIADSVADAVTFGVAPAILVAIHSGPAWAAWDTAALLVAALYTTAAFVRLGLFTAHGFERKYFLGVPTPQAALAVIVALLFHSTPAFQSVQPIGVLVGVAAISVLMVAPIPYPKIRAGARLRWPMAFTGIAAAVTLVPLQFRPAAGSPLYLLAYAAGIVLLVGVACYYVLGPFTVDRDAPSAPSTGPAGPAT
jgi:archaetidylserine synthase